MRYRRSPLYLCSVLVIAAAVAGIAQPDQVSLFGPGVISKPNSEESFTSLSPDGREFYFTRHQPNFGQHSIMVSKLTGGAWSEPQTVSFSGKGNDREPRLSPDGKRMYFSSNRPIPNQPPTRLDLFMAERGADGQWGEPRRLEAPINTEAHEFCPVVVANGTLYFISTRPGGIVGPTPTNLHNVWRAKALDQTGLRFAEPENLGKAINIGLETNVFVTPDERIMLISRDGAPDSLGGDDLYVSRFVSGAWQPMRHLPAPINTDKYEYGPSLTTDGQWLLFTSARGGTADIYQAPARMLGK